MNPKISVTKLKFNKLSKNTLTLSLSPSLLTVNNKIQFKPYGLEVKWK